MSLKFEHLVAHRINWESKYQNLQSLAGELNLGLDSFVFLDDNPVECGQIRQILPQVMTLQVPLDHEVSSFLNHLWAFDKLAITDEDVKRTQMYRENTTRQQMEDASTDIGAFLSSLELVIDIGQPDEEEWPRIAQLTQRTNQFNFTTVRRNESDIRALAATDSMLVQRVKVRDRFGDYGLVGLVISRHADDALVIDTLLLSCRVLGRGVEHAMLRNLGEIATGAGHDRIDLPYLQTQKNEPARAFADSVASTFRTGETDSVVYRIPVSAACKIMHTPGEDPEEVIEAKRSDGKKKPAKLATPEAGKSCSDRYEKLAGNLINGETVLAYIRTQHMRERSLATLKVDAETDIEGELLVLWQELLGVNGLGVEDDYFAIGGTSLLAARLFSEIAGRYGVRLRLTTILDAPTIRSLARYINPNQTAGTGVLVNLKSGHEKTLFLVHDGDGETLLYRNLAAHLPATVSVVGIEPYSILNIPMAHVSIDDIADFYVNAIRQRQPHGPYLLGGLCAGGLIAYVIATRLVRAGEEVKMVAILDAAVPGAVERIGQVTQERTNKLTAMLQSVQEMNMGTLQRWVYISNMLLKKITNALRWEIGSRYALLSTLLRFKVLKYVLANNKAWPSWIRELSVREIYVSAEAGCQLVSDANIKVLLVRASSGLEDDKPYREVYLDDTFGWRKIAPQLDVVDVDGGHASMLQEPNVVSLASIIKQYAILN
jgi:FkbH-like protein